MPVYLFTVHAYRSWSEGNANGFIQHGEGLQPPNPRLAQWRRDHASDEPARFDADEQRLLHETLVTISRERAVTLYGGSTTPTHVHGLASFIAPTCGCGGAEWCRRECPARKYVEQYLTRLKQMMGRALMLRNQTNGRKYFSRGWDLTPIRRKPHFDYHLDKYLPDHAKQNGIFKCYLRPTAGGYSPAAMDRP